MTDGTWPDLPDDLDPYDASDGDLDPLGLPTDGLEHDLFEHDLLEHGHLGHDPLAHDHSEPAPDDPPSVSADEIVLALPPDGLDAADSGTVPGEALVDVFGLSAPAYADVVDRLGLGDALDGHSAAVVLGELGLDASVRHGDLDALAASVAAGAEVLVQGPLGQLTVTHVDDVEVVLVDPASGDVTRVDTAGFEQAWEHASYAMVVAEPLGAPGEVVLSTGPVTVLSLSWPGP